MYSVVAGDWWGDDVQPSQQWTWYTSFPGTRPLILGGWTDFPGWALHIPSARYGTCQKKKKQLTFECFSEDAVAMQLHCKSNDFFQESEGFFQKSRSFFPKSTGFVHSFTYRSSGAVFVSSRALLVMAKQHSNGNSFHKCTLFFDAYCT